MWLSLAVLVVSVLLKLLRLRDTFFQKPSPSKVLIGSVSCFLEVFGFISILVLLLWLLTINKQSTNFSSEKYRMIYPSLIFPELLRALAVVLHTFDSKPNLLFLLGLMVLSIQFMALQSLLRVSNKALLTCFTAALTVRLLTKLCFYTYDDISLLGFLT